MVVPVALPMSTTRHCRAAASPFSVDDDNDEDEDDDDDDDDGRGSAARVRSTTSTLVSMTSA